ncbi:HPr(Ser) kinase/phosphatase [Candidatus Eisenbacteria bacterium]|uniref:HPr(Ser) kinase/phosphatase n=1 Tax=Eiseniibacteriota bacterium TaxID=2212470 RepID=A0ABV6YNA8_UNCEI
MEANPLNLSRILAECGDPLGLSLLSEKASLKRGISQSDIGRPGLALTGFTDAFEHGRIQVMDRADVIYLEGLPAGEVSGRMRLLSEASVPCIIVAGGVEVPECLSGACLEAGIALMSATASATETVQHLNTYLLTELAPESSLSGTLVDVHGVGILITGKSGIGKSECALALVGRGHRLVADDHVCTIARPPGMLIGRSIEPLQSFVEVRGIGPVDIGSIYGVRALRRQKRIEIEVVLKEWEEGAAYDRTGLDRTCTELMGVRIPSIVVPLVPGKSVSVIIEVVALSHILRTYGYDAAGSLDKRWTEHIEKNRIPGFESRDIE